MGLIENIKAKLKIMNVSSQTQRHASPLMLLGTNLFTAALKCGEGTQSFIKERYGEDSSESKFMFVRVCYEYLFFFLHMVDRIVLSELGPEVRANLQELLYPLVQKGSTEAFCRHWPNEIKEKVNADFVVNLNSANYDYAQCKSIYDQEAPLAKSSVVGNLGHRISGVLSMDKNLPLVVTCTSVGLSALSILDLKKAIIYVCRKL